MNSAVSNYCSIASLNNCPANYASRIFKGPTFNQTICVNNFFESAENVSRGQAFPDSQTNNFGREAPSDECVAIRYKTELCRFFDEQGSCKFGRSCVFAHGKEELRKPLNCHPRHKTVKCKAFHGEGFCSFGPRCSFLHTKPDLGKMLKKLEYGAKAFQKLRNEEKNYYLSKAEIDLLAVADLNIIKDLLRILNHCHESL